MLDQSYMDAIVNTIVEHLEADGLLIKGSYNSIKIEYVDGNPLMTFYNNDECIHILDMNGYRDSLS